MKNKRLNGLGAAAMYVGLKMALEQIELWEIWDYRTAVWRLGAALSILAVLALCFYRAFRLITVFLVVAFQAIADISRYASVCVMINAPIRRVRDAGGEQGRCRRSVS